VLPLFDFALAQAQHCRSVSGSETMLLIEASNPEGISTIRDAESADEMNVPIGILLKPDKPDLWFQALQQ
jgi:hypothetical protein